MNRRVLLTALIAALSCGASIVMAPVSAQAPASLGAPADVRFATIDVFVDSPEPLAAWQFELTDTAGAMTVVGVENGASSAFPEAPHFDLAAVQQGRADHIIVADYSLADRTQLPTGRTRIATIHVQLSGAVAPDFALELIAAGNADGQPIRVEANLEWQDGRAQ